MRKILLLHRLVAIGDPLFWEILAAAIIYMTLTITEPVEAKREKKNEPHTHGSNCAVRNL